MPEGCRGCCATLILVPLLVCSILVCGIVYVTTEAPEAPISDSFSPRQSEADAFEAELSRAANQARTQGWFYLNFNERQLSSWMALEGEQFAEEHENWYFFDDVQVSLRDGEITFWGVVARGAVEVPLQVVLVPEFDQQGRMTMSIESADVGGVPLPGLVLENVEDQLEDVLLDEFDRLGIDYIFFEQSLSIANGIFALQGTVRN